MPSGSFEANALSYTDPREASFHTWVLLPALPSISLVSLLSGMIAKSQKHPFSGGRRWGPLFQ